MSAQPKPTTGEGMPGGHGKPWVIPATGEWTVEEGNTVVGNGWRIQTKFSTGADTISDAHNAAIDAERERADKNADVLEATALELGDAREQLADERSKVQTLVDALKAIPAMLDKMPVRTSAYGIKVWIETALAKIGTYPK